MPRRLTVPVRQRAILIAAGLGGSIAARFNTSIGGIAFAVEMMLVLGDRKISFHLVRVLKSS